MKRGTLVIGAIVGLVVILGFMGVSSYNKLVGLDQGVKAQWAQVESVYQRRADLIPNLVETVKGAANFERETIVAVTEARARVGQVKIDSEVLEDPEAFKKVQAAQDQLSQTVSRLLVVSEAYPELKATQGFRDLQVQLEGTENRITVERQRYNDAARGFNSQRNSFPTVVMAGLFGFKEKQYFESTPGSDKAPSVKF